MPEVQGFECPDFLFFKCQFCGNEAPCKEWLDDGYRCPKCNQVYDALKAQEEEED